MQRKDGKTGKGQQRASQFGAKTGHANVLRWGAQANPRAPPIADAAAQRTPMRDIAARIATSRPARPSRRLDSRAGRDPKMM